MCKLWYQDNAMTPLFRRRRRVEKVIRLGFNFVNGHKKRRRAFIGRMCQEVDVETESPKNKAATAKLPKPPKSKVPANCLTPPPTQTKIVPNNALLAVIQDSNAQINDLPLSDVSESH